MFYLIAVALAANCGQGEISTDIGCIPNAPEGFASAIYQYGLTLIGGVALIFIMYGGYLILSSQGDPEKLKIGKSYIIYSLVGLIMALTGFVFYQTVAKNILKIPGFQ